MSTPPERLQSALFDRYTVERELGAGGMATVYLALDVKHRRQVAVKVLREDLAASMGSARFLREIEIAAQLQHPHILPLLDSGEADGFLYYVMPFVKGQSLRERLTREGELPIPEAVRLITEVVDALALAHEHGVIHRDIKPDNVMVSGRHALVMDFGVAKAISEATGRSTVTTLGVALGTPAYMSPEQAAADPHVDHRTDIYAVGVMLYEMLTGRPPFTGNTPQQVLAAQVTEAPDPVSKRRPSIPPALEAIVMRCLAKRPADRFQTATELHAALEPLSTPSLGTTPAATRPLQSSSARRPVMWAGLGVLTVAAVAIVVMRRPPRPPAEPTAYDRVKITSTGNASSPSLSPDAREVSYTSRTCDETGACSAQLVISDLASGVQQVIADSLDSVASKTWSASGSWLLFDGAAVTRGKPYGAFVIFHLGGGVTRLGETGDFVPRGDTALAADQWVIGSKRAVMVSSFVSPWSQAVDSVSITAPDSATWFSALRVDPSGRWLAVAWSSNNGPPRVTIYDRQGHLASSRLLPSFDRMVWDASGEHLLCPFVNQAKEGGIQRVAVDPASGRIGLIDTLIIAASNTAPTIGVSRDGTRMVYGATVADENVLWTLERAAGTWFPRPARRIRVSSSEFNTKIAADGNTVLIPNVVPLPTTGGRQVQLLAMPFNGGPERVVLPAIPARMTHGDLTTNSQRIIFVTSVSKSLSHLIAYRLSDGTPTDLADVGIVPSETQPAGPDGIAFFTASDSVVVLDAAGLAVRRFAMPDPVKGTHVVATSPVGDGYVLERPPSDLSTEYGRDGNSRFVFYRLSLTGTVSLIGSVRLGSSPNNYSWSTDGVFRFVGSDAAYPQDALYSVPVTGGEIRRGEPFPFPDGCQCSLSADGKRGVAVLSRPLQDIWLIRNFGPAKH